MSDRPTLASTIAALANQTLTGADRVIVSAGPLETAHPEQLSYMDNAKYLDALRHTRAGVCLVSKRYQSDVPAGTIAIVTDEPYNIYAIALQHLYAGAMIPRSSLTVGGTFEKGAIHPSAAVGAGVIIEPGVVVGPRSRIGDGCYIGANTVIGPDVVTGRNCHVYANVVISFATIGDRVIVHPGAKIGQDGFGFVPRPSGHIKVPQVGSVVIGDDVEIGSNTTVDRGSIKNTVIGRGTKIDNLVQIAHNVVIGSHCIIAAQTGIAGSTVLGDFVMVGGHAAIASHLSIGSLAQIAAASGVMRDIPPRGRYAGIPARPVARFFRQYKTVERLAEQRTRSGDEHPAAD